MLLINPVYVSATVLVMLSLFHLLLFIIFIVSSVSRLSACSGATAKDTEQKTSNCVWLCPTTSSLTEFRRHPFSSRVSITSVNTDINCDVQHSQMLRGDHYLLPSALHHSFVRINVEQSNCVSSTWAEPLTSLGKTGGEGDVERRVVEWCVGGWRKSLKHHKVSCCHLRDGC